MGRRWIGRALVGLALVSIPWTARAAGTLLDDVVRMLEERVDPAVISSWLSLQEPTGVPLSPDDLIRLSRAGAPDALVQQLLALGRTQKPPAPAPVARGLQPPPPPDDATVPVATAVTYRPYASFDMEDQDKLDLYVYVDGALVARVRPQNRWPPAQDPEVALALEPGRHTLRLLRESHERQGGKDERWRHEARACPDVVEFEVAPGHDWSLDVEWTEPRFSTAAPLTWRLLRDGLEAAGAEKIGTPTDRWPHVCEDLESRKASRLVAREMESCVRWTDLWGQLSVESSTRAAVLAELERPPVRKRRR